MRCCADDEGFGPSEPPCGGGFKPPRAALVDDRRGERRGKGALDGSGRDREGERKRIAADVSLTKIKWHQNRGPGYLFGMSLAETRLLARRCPAWRRHELDLLHLRGTWEGVPGYFGVGCVERGRAPSGRNREGLSTVAGRAFGLTHSSDETPVMGVERRGQVVRDQVVRSTGR